MCTCERLCAFLIDAAVDVFAAVVQPKFTNKILQAISASGIESTSLSHLRRVKKQQDRRELLVLIGEVKAYNSLPDNVKSDLLALANEIISVSVVLDIWR